MIHSWLDARRVFLFSRNNPLSRLNVRNRCLVPPARTQISAFSDSEFRFFFSFSEYGIRLRRAVCLRSHADLTIHIFMNFYSLLARALAPVLMDNACGGGGGGGDESVGLGNFRGNYTV